MRPIQFHQLAFYLIAAFILCGFTVQAAPRALQASIQAPEYGLRQALVIANGDYQVGKLNNPVNDGRLIADALRQTGFKVTLLENAKRQSMLNAIARFGEQIEQGGTGLVYYAGHGLQVNGENWLIPVDANIQREEDVLSYGVNLQQVLDRMQAARNPFNLVLLDACRNNPYPKANRSQSGLARVDAGLGMLIAFSTAPGQTAADGDTNSYFAEALARHMQTPGLPIESLLKRVRSDVRQISKNKQITWDSSSLEGEFYFLPILNTSVVPPAVVTTTSLTLAQIPIKDKNTRDFFPNYTGQISVDDLFRAKELGERFKLIGARWAKWMTDTAQKEYQQDFLRETEIIKQRYELRGKDFANLPAKEQRDAANVMFNELQGELAQSQKRLEQKMAKLSSPFSRFIDEFKQLLQSKQLDAAEARLNQAEEQMKLLRASQ